MTHGKRPRHCRICGNKLTIGGAWYKCSRCGWTDKPKSQKIQEQRHKAEKLNAAFRSDKTPPPTKEEIAARKKKKEKRIQRKVSHFQNWIRRMKKAKDNMNERKKLGEK